MKKTGRICLLIANVIVLSGWFAGYLWTNVCSAKEDLDDKLIPSTEE